MLLVNPPAHNAADTRNLGGDVGHRFPGPGSAAATTVVLQGGLITLSQHDRQALATYGGLEELHLDGNMVAHVPARYFSVVPRLKVLSLSRNKISR